MFLLHIGKIYIFISARYLRITNERENYVKELNLYNMESNPILQSRKEIYSHLDNKHLKQAFRSLKEFIKQLGEWRYEEKIDQLQTDYQYMLRYMGEGFNDPERDKLYRKLLADTYLLTDIVTDRFLQRSVSSLYYSKRRLFLNGSDTLQNAAKRLEKETGNLSLAQLLDTTSPEDEKKIAYLEREVEEAAQTLFNAVWTNFAPTNEERKQIELLFEPATLPVIYQQMIISALILSLLTWYDEGKLFLLIDLATSPEPELSQRALVGVLLVLQAHQKQLTTTLSVKNRLDILFENPLIAQQISTIQTQFIRTRETERITRKLNEEILPEMMKMASPLYNKIKTDDLLKDTGEPDMNPEWEDFIEKSGIGNKIKEISELQLEGSDVLMSAFSNLKNFPFFKQTGNWFMPFYPYNSEVSSIFKSENQNQQFLDFISKSRFLCNSDKYSFCLSLTQMPEMQRKMMTDQFSAQGEELEQMQKMDEEQLPAKKTETISNLYIQDLYRFFKLHPQHDEFQDPFNHDLLFFRNTFLKPLFSDIYTLHLVAELLFRKEFFEDAAAVYRDLTMMDHTNYEFFQKLGYCYQALGQYDKAVTAYIQADIIHPDSPWTLRRIALCYRNLKKPAEALAYYERFNKLKPDNLSVELNMGHCYLEIKDYENALTHYFKVDYLDTTTHKAWRPIAWCSFLIGKYNQAERYYKKIIENHPGPLDLINAGHTAWVLNDIRKAIEYYRAALQLWSNERDLFEKTFLQDKHDLLHAGIPETDFYLMLDQLLYDSEEQ